MSQSDGFDRKSFLQSLLLLILLVVIAGGMGVYVLSDSDIDLAYALAAAATKIDLAYPEEIVWDDLIKSARDAMFDRLDRYSSFYEPVNFESLDEEMTGGYTGIGVTVVDHDEGLLLISVRENGPAGAVGLLPGDIVIGADSVLMVDLARRDAARRLRGPEGTKVLVRVRRPITDETFEVEITRAHIPFEHIPFAGLTPDSVLYIRLYDFDPGASDDLRAALDSLLGDDRPRPKGIILDLSGNPGGLFLEAYETADLFLEGGKFLVGTNGRSFWHDQQFYSTGEDLTGGLPMAVIVDRGSASSAEIVSGALQQNGRAVLIGDTTFGKGLVQGFVRFPDGDGLKLTISRYYFEGGVYLNDFDSMLHDTGHGLVPDHYFDMRRISPFQRTLENKLLLRQFVGLHLDSIIDNIENDRLDRRWLDSLAAYAAREEFVYISPRTELAGELVRMAKLEECSPKTKRLADRIERLSRHNDLGEIYQNEEYIMRRLKQIAYENKYGVFHAYREVLIRTRPEIAFAARILLGEER